VVGNTIGIGIFLLPVSLAPYGLNALWAWVITIAGCVLLTIVFAGLARAFPRDDGPYAYIQRAFGSDVTFFVLWSYWFATWVTNTTIASGIVGYLAIVVPSLRAAAWLQPYVALALVWLFVLVNCLGIRAAAWTQIGTTALKLLPQLGIILLGVWQLWAHPAAVAANIPPDPVSPRAVLEASTLAMFAMLGIECALIPAGKVLDPARTIPRATIVGMLIAGMIYLCASSIPLLLIPRSELAVSTAPFADLFGKYLGARSGRWLALFIVIGGLGALNGWTLIVGEMTRSFAVHKTFPAIFGRLNSRAAPAYAFLLTGFLASVMLVVSYSPSLASVFTFLIKIVTAANLPLYLACSLAVLVLWRKGEMPDVGHRGRAATWYAAALLAAVFCVWVFAGVGGVPFLWALLLAVAGIPFWWIARVKRRGLSST
jgi:APA family basic amino acid/polyamine antiporter